MRRRSSSESQSDYERERDRRRRLWVIQQEREREHEKLKQKKIEEYERKRAELLKLSKLNLSEENTSSPSNSKGSNAGEEDLKQIVVKIQRNLPASSMTEKKANNSEGTTDEEKLIQSQPQTLDIEEYRTVEVTNKKSRAKESQFERRSMSLNVKTQRSLSPEYRRSSYVASHRSRRDEYSRRNVNDYDDRDRRSSRHSSRSRDNSRDKIKKRKTSRGRSYSRGRRTSRGRSNSRSRRSSRGRSHSRERDHGRSERDYSRSSRTGRNQEYRGRSRDRSRDRRDEQGIPRDWFQLPYPYVGPMPYPAFYGSFPPGSMMFEPHMMPPIRGPRGVPMTVPPMRPPYPPRFIPPHPYRGPLARDPHYQWMN